MKLILFPLTEIRNCSNAVETEGKLVLHYQCPSTFKNPKTEFLSWHLEDQGNLGIPWLSFKGALDFWQEPEEMICSYANLSHDKFWSAYGTVYAIHKVSLMRNLTHSSL